jgi:SAM-dependent methyltransferase
MSTGAGAGDRREAYLQHGRGTIVDRFGVWLSARQLRRHVPSFAGKRVGDFGCGYQASFARGVLGEAASVVLVDVALAEDLKADGLKADGRVRAVEGRLPDALAALPDASLDVILLVSVLEHVTEPQRLLAETARLLAPDGVALINVPSWRGKRYLELATFRLHLGEASEIDDHKAYYDVRDLWPMLVAAGFRPSRIKCFPHKFGLNTFAVCRAAP